MIYNLISIFLLVFVATCNTLFLIRFALQNVFAVGVRIYKLAENWLEFINKVTMTILYNLGLFLLVCFTVDGEYFFHLGFFFGGSDILQTDLTGFIEI